jgi:hypothetical protein
MDRWHDSLKKCKCLASIFIKLLFYKANISTYLHLLMAAFADGSFILA